MSCPVNVSLYESNGLLLFLFCFYYYFGLSLYCETFSPSFFSIICRLNLPSLQVTHFLKQFFFLRILNRHWMCKWYSHCKVRSRSRGGLAEEPTSRWKIVPGPRSFRFKCIPFFFYKWSLKACAKFDGNIAPILITSIFFPSPCEEYVGTANFKILSLVAVEWSLFLEGGCHRF